MKIRFLLTTLLFLTTSCTQGKLPMYNLINSNNVLATQKDADGNVYTIKANPAPNQLYDFTVTLTNAPENLILTKAYAQYETDCAFIVDKFAGAYSKFRHSIPLEVKKIQDNVYHATVYGDAILNEDYYNIGKMCGWKLQYTTMIFEPNPNLSRRGYITRIWLEKDNQISDKYWKLEGYISLDNFNHPRNSNPNSVLGNDILSFNIHTTKPKTNNFATISVELRGK